MKLFLVTSYNESAFDICTDDELFCIGNSDTNLTLALYTYMYNIRYHIHDYWNDEHGDTFSECMQADSAITLTYLGTFPEFETFEELLAHMQSLHPEYFL